MRLTLGAVLFCLALLTLCAADNCLRWTPWINGDQNWKDGGDFETVGYSNVFEGGRVGRVTKKLEHMGIICNNPLKIECRVAHKGLPWYRAGDNTKFPSRINCDSRRGFVCRKDQQADGNCADYEVRLLCWRTCSQLKWTSWVNRDRPSGYCDCEHPGWMDHPVRNGPACPDGQSPAEVECQTTGGVSAANGPDAKVQCDVNNGFSCFNKRQPNGRCQADYRVRYLCFSSQSGHGRRTKSKRQGSGIIPNHSFFPLT